MSTNLSNNLTQSPAVSQAAVTRRRFLAFAAGLPLALATALTERELLAALIGDSGVLNYTNEQLAAITAPSADPGAEIAHLRVAVEVYEQVAAQRRARLAWLETF